MLIAVIDTLREDIAQMLRGHLNGRFWNVTHAIQSEGLGETIERLANGGCHLGAE